MPDLPDGYRLRLGSFRDRALLLKYLNLSYQECFPQQPDFSHLARTVEKYLTPETRHWWVQWGGEPGQDPDRGLSVGCLWLGNAIDQVSGERYAHIFLLYVLPEHRRRGIGIALMQRAQEWAKTRGDRQIGLQVFSNNQPALTLYQRLGYCSHSLVLLKLL